jgi:hypothetical protein
MGMMLTAPDDAASASARVKSDIPGRGKEAQKAGEEGMESVRARAQSMVSLCYHLTCCFPQAQG